MKIDFASIGSDSLAASGLDSIAPSIGGGFEAHLVQASPGSGPPGAPPPPPRTSGEKEQQTQEPNAQSHKPDPFSQEKPQASSQPAAPLKAAAAPTKDEGKQTGLRKANAQANPPESQANSATDAKSSGKTGQAEQQSAVIAGQAALVGLASETAATPSVLPNGMPAAGGGPSTVSVAPGKVSLAELPTSPVAEIISAKAGAALDSGAAPTQAPVATQSPEPNSQSPTVQAAATKPAAQKPSAGSHDGQSAPQISGEGGGSANASNPPSQPIQTQQATPSANQPSSQLQQADHKRVSDQTEPVVTAPQAVPIHPIGGGHPAGTPQLMQAAASASVSTGSGSSQQPRQDGRQSNLDMLRQMAEHADRLAAVKAGENVTVHLQSENDTDVTLTVKASRGEVQAQIVTNNDSLRNALHQNRPDLERTLLAKGMSMGQVSVGLNDSSAGRSSQQRSSSATVRTEKVLSGGEADAPRTTSGLDLEI